MIYIVIKEFDEDLAKRQPWYTVQQLLCVLTKSGYDVSIVNKVPNETLRTGDHVIKIFSLKDILIRPKVAKNQLTYLMTFSLYDSKIIRRLGWKTIYENFSKIDRILIMSLIPKFFIKRSLIKAATVISISDRSTNFLKTMDINPLRFIPFKANDDGNKIRIEPGASVAEAKFGYFGPPYATRYFFEVADYAIRNVKNNNIKSFHFVLRIDDTISQAVKAKIEELLSVPGITVRCGFLSRDNLLAELQDVQVFILPFKIVMAEFPVVALEALSWDKIVLTNDESGILSSFSDFPNLKFISDAELAGNKKIIVERPKKSSVTKLQEKIFKINQDFSRALADILND